MAKTPSRVYQKGRKKCSTCPNKKVAHSTDKDPDFVDESEEETKRSGDNTNGEVHLFDDSDDD